MRIECYEPKNASIWDKFIDESNNGVFLFKRNYMDYHADRFADHSLMFFDNSKLIAVLPANLNNDVLFSHGGLTFGGVVCNNWAETQLMLEIFNELVKHCTSIGVKKVVYKAIPHIYHKYPSEADLYALFRNDAKLVRRDVSSTIFTNQRIPFSKNRRWCINKSIKHGLEVKRSYDFKSFMSIEAAVLGKKYGVKPTHNTQEIQLLAERFPENIKLFAAYKDDEMLSGAIVYESENVAHTQYISSTDKGKKLYATDLVLAFLVNDYYSKKQYFDFGISTEQNGRYLNSGLIAFKEEFGARSIVYDTYELETAKI